MWRGVRTLIGVSWPAQLHPKGGTVEVQSENQAAAIVELVFDFDGADPAAARAAYHASSPTYLQADWGVSRQTSTVDLVTDPVLKLARQHDAAPGRAQSRNRDATHWRTHPGERLRGDRDGDRAKWMILGGGISLVVGLLMAFIAARFGNRVMGRAGLGVSGVHPGGEQHGVAGRGRPAADRRQLLLYRARAHCARHGATDMGGIL